MSTVFSNSRQKPPGYNVLLVSVLIYNNCVVPHQLAIGIVCTKGLYFSRLVLCWFSVHFIINHDRYSILLYDGDTLGFLA